MVMNLILIRHGNAIRVNGDYLHAPLTALGRQQAELTGQFLADQAPGGFYASPLLRAKETAEIIGRQLGKTPEIKNGIQEVERLEVAVLSIVELFSIFDPIENYLDSHAGKALHWPIQGRVANAMLEIFAAHPDQQVIVVVHAGVISSVLAWMFPEKRLKWWRTTVSNCSITRFRLDGEKVELVAVNEIGHLKATQATDQPPTDAVEATKTVMEAVKPTKQ